MPPRWRRCARRWTTHWHRAEPAAPAADAVASVRHGSPRIAPARLRAVFGRALTPCADGKGPAPAASCHGQGEHREPMHAQLVVVFDDGLRDGLAGRRAGLFLPPRRSRALPARRSGVARRHPALARQSAIGVRARLPGARGQGEGEAAQAARRGLGAAVAPQPQSWRGVLRIDARPARRRLRRGRAQARFRAVQLLGQQGPRCLSLGRRCRALAGPPWPRERQPYCADALPGPR